MKVANYDKKFQFSSTMSFKNLPSPIRRMGEGRVRAKMLIIDEPTARNLVEGYS
jgi:hypothetical protein